MSKRIRTGDRVKLLTGDIGTVAAVYNRIATGEVAAIHLDKDKVNVFHHIECEVKNLVHAS